MAAAAVAAATTKAIAKETAAASAAGVKTAATTTGTVMVMVVAETERGSASLKSRRRHKGNNIGRDKGSDGHGDGCSDDGKNVDMRDDDSGAVMVAAAAGAEAVIRRRVDGDVRATMSAATRAAHVDPARQAGKVGDLLVRDYLSGAYP